MQIRIFKTFAPVDDQLLLLVVTVLFLMGIGMGDWLPPSLFWGYAAGGAGCLAWLAFRRGVCRSTGRMDATGIAAAALCAVCAGAGRMAWDAHALAREAALLNALDQPQAFVCRVTSDATFRPLTGMGARYTFSAADVTWRSGEDTFRLRRLPLVVDWYGSAYDDLQAPQPGEVWQLHGRVQVTRRANGQTRAYLSTRKGDQRTARLAPVSASWRGRLSSIQHAAVRRVALGVEDWGVVPALNQAMLLGCRNEMPDEMRRVFAVSGTIHVFAISGLHIALVAGVLIFFVRLFGLTRPRWIFLVVPLVVTYTILTGMRPSAIRACCMAACILFAPLADRKPNALTALLVTVLALHLWQPSLLFNAGNVLSFAVMAGLIVFVPSFSACLRRISGVAAHEQKAALLAAAGSAAHARWQRRKMMAARHLADAFAVSLAAWLVSVPLTGHYFGRVAIGGLFANIAVVPCAFMVIAAGCLGVLTGLFSPWTAVCFNHAAGFFTHIMVWIAERTAAVKWLSFETGPWPGWTVALWFAALSAWALWLHLRPDKPDGLEWFSEGAM